MLNQKRRSPHQQKKLKNVKSQEIIFPLGSLRQEISQLKKELKDIKSAKKENHKFDRDISTQSQPNQFLKIKKSLENQDHDKTVANLKTFNKQKIEKENQFEWNKRKKMLDETVMDQSKKCEKVEECSKKCEKIELMEVYYAGRDKKLKLDIQINKLRKALMFNETESIVRQINQTFSMINLFNEVLSQEKIDLEETLKELEESVVHQKNDLQDKYKAVIKTNHKLEAEVKHLKQHLFTVIQQEQFQQADQHKRHQGQQQGYNQQQGHHQQQGYNQQQQIEMLAHELNCLMETNKKMHNVIQQLQLKNKAIEEISLAFQKSIERKEEELILFREDVNYLRIQSEKFKIQKNDFQKLYHNLTQENKELKRHYAAQLDSLEREKNKWFHQCHLRRNQSQEIQSIETQKAILLKQLQELRSCYTNKCNQLNEAKGLLHENQRKLINVETELYKTQTQNEKLQRNNQFCQYELGKMNEEVEELRKVKSHKHSETRADIMKKRNQQEEDKKQKEQKLKALDDIHSLIRKHKEEIESSQ